VIQIAADPRPFPFHGLDGARTAVLLIDMQRDFLDPEGYLAATGYDLGSVRAAIPPARRLLDAARAHGLPVVHTRQGYWPDLRELPPHRLELTRSEDSVVGKRGPLGRFLIRGEPGFQTIPELSPRAGELVVDKSGTGAFYGTDLASILSARDIRSLIVAGVTTDVCVHTTIREATDRGFECLVVADACASGDPELHRAAIEMVKVEDGTFGVVADVAAVVGAIARL
jgi:biuret amidohydrolase